MRTSFAWASIAFLVIGTFAAAEDDIVFVSDRTGNWELWSTSSTNPADATRITHMDGSGAPFHPKWSPDGQWIAFHSGMPGISQSSEIFVVSSDGTVGPFQLTDLPGTANQAIYPDFGADSEWIYYLKVWPAQRSEIWRVNHQTLTHQPVNQRPNTNFQTFEVSPDGTERVEMRENGCCWTPNMYTVLHDLTTPSETTIVPTDGHAEWGPRVGPVTKRVVYYQATGHSSPINVWTMNLDGTNRTQLTSSLGNVGNSYPVWAPDESQILYSTNQDGNQDLMLVDPGTSIITPFMVGPQNDTTPDWREVDNAFACSGRKEAVCHVPPGNAEQAHTICVSSAAVLSHLAHGDYLGVCGN